MQQDFLPSDDGGRLTGQIQAQNGTSPDQMYKYLDEVSRVINADPNVEGVFGQIPGGNGTAGANSGFLNIIVLKPLSQRKLSADQIDPRAPAEARRFPGINVFLTNPPTIRIGGRGSRSQYQYTMQDLDLERTAGCVRPADGADEGDARLCRRQLRSRRRDAGGAGQDRSRPRRRARRHGPADRNRAGRGLRRHADLADQYLRPISIR